MADFGTYLTPDGRQVTLPSDFASNFVGLTPVPPSAPELPAAGAAPGPAPGAPPAAPTGGEPAWTPDNTAALVAQTPPPAMPTDGPVTSPDQIPPSTGQPGPRPQGAVLSPAEDTGVSSLAPPAPVPGGPGTGPLTNDQLAKIGNAGAYNVQQQGVNEERAAVRRQGEALANQATAVGHTMAAADAEADRLLQQRQKVAEDNARALQAKQDEYLRNAKAIADVRIDRSIDHPVMTAIGLMLSSLGAAMKGQSNEAAIKGVYEALDRKVAGQMQDLDQKRQGLGIQREAIGMQAQAGKDRLEQLDTYRIAAIEQVKRKIETIRQQTTSDIVRSNSELALASLTQKQGEILNGAVGREQQKREAAAARAQAMQVHRDTMALTIRGQNMEQGRFEAQLAETRQDKAAALAERLIEKGDTASAAKVKLLGEQAIVDPGTGDYMLTPAGQQKMAQADSYEAKARQATDPEQAKRLNAAAQQLRDSAQVNDAAVALNKEGAKEAQKTAKIAQDMANNVDAARRMLNAGPEAWNRDQWAQITVALQGVKVNYAQQMGERMSPRALDAIDDVLSIDPGSIWSRSADKGKAIAALDTVEKQINQSADVALKGAGVKSGWTPAKRVNSADFSGKTAQEVAEGAEPGALTQYVINPIAHPIDTALGERTPEKLKQQAFDEASARTGKLADGSPGRPSNYGLAPQTESTVDGLIKRAGSAGHAEYGRILNNLKDPLLLISGQGERPSLAIGVARKLQDEDPKLFDAVIAHIANIPGGGQVKADEITKAIAPVSGQPAGGALTPAARDQLTTQKQRVRAGLPPNVEPPPQMRDVTPVQLPPFVRTMSPADRAKWLDWARNNGFAGALAGVK